MYLHVSTQSHMRLFAFGQAAPGAQAIAAMCAHAPITAITCTQHVGIAARAFFVVLLLSLNSIGLAAYLRGMRQTGSAAATLQHSAASFICAGVSGALLDNDVLNSQWLAGAALVGAGLSLMTLGGNGSVHVGNDATVLQRPSRRILRRSSSKGARPSSRVRRRSRGSAATQR